MGGDWRYGKCRPVDRLWLDPVDEPNPADSVGDEERRSGQLRRWQDLTRRTEMEPGKPSTLAAYPLTGFKPVTVFGQSTVFG